MFGLIKRLFDSTDKLTLLALNGNEAEFFRVLDDWTVYIPQRPILPDSDPGTPEELVKSLEENSEKLGGDDFDPWIIQDSGRKILPVYISQELLQQFSKNVTTEMNRIVPVGCVGIKGRNFL